MPTYRVVFVLAVLIGGCGSTSAVPRQSSMGQRTTADTSGGGSKTGAEQTPRSEDIPEPGSPAVGLAGGEPPDVVRYLMVRRAWDPSPAPDGEQLAFRTNITGDPQLWVADSRTDRAPSAAWPEQRTFGRSVTFHGWAPDGEWIAYGMDREGNEREGFYLVTPDGRRERELAPPSEAFRQFGGFSQDGERIAYATTEGEGADFDIHVMDVDAGDAREALAGRMGLYVAAWRPDGEALVLTEARGEDGNDLHMLDLRRGERQTLFAPEDASSYRSIAWKPDSSGFYLVTDHDRDRAALAYYDVASEALSFVEEPDNEVEQVVLSHDGELLGWTENVGGWSRLHLRDLKSGRDIDPPPELPRGIYDLAFARRTNALAIEVRSPRIPGDIWMWRPRAETSHTLRRVTSSTMAGLDPDRLVVPEHVEFAARDGVTLRGLLYMPPETGDEPPPVLLSLHGGPTVQARPSFNPVDQYLLARGIAVLDLNYRGSTGYGKRFARLDNKRRRPDAIRDMEDAVEWMKRDGRLDASRVAVMGGSYGGFMTFAALVHFPQTFVGGVSFVGVSDWITALEGASPQLKASDREEYGDIDDPEDREFFRELSPITHVNRIEAPLLVAHGANDPRDPVTESDRFVRAVREGGGEVEYMRFADEGHGIRKLKNRVYAYRRVAAFLERVFDIDDAS